MNSPQKYGVCYLKNTLFILGIVVLSKPVFAAPCKISQSIYRDANSQGFELVFGPPVAGTPFLATATINHPQHSQLHRFHLTQANGYGSISLLIRTAGQQPKQNHQGFRLNFFNQDSKSATPGVFGRESEAPQYAFITDLGSFDYYQRRGQITGSTPPAMRDNLWIHDRCL